MSESIDQNFSQELTPQDASKRLPVEIIIEILKYLEVPNYLTAREISKVWYETAMDESLLRGLLKRYGWSSDVTVTNYSNANYLIKRLQMEHNLGNFTSMNSTSLKLAAVTEVAESPFCTSNRVTVSVCQEFFMLCEGSKVYIYKLRGLKISLFCYITCPRAALHVSMDTTGNRMSIAILLNGRTGLVLDVGEGRVTSIYRNICMYDDPPISVAICSQRRCVAFGCRARIELHWVDGVTGENQNRWFPLNSPSDFLYFVPTPAGYDLTRKLRLISSAIHPDQAPSAITRVGVTRDFVSVWGDLNRRHHDHYQALPLSDGHHVLFTDPQTGKLCVGSDAPLGGPFKLIRRIILLGPTYLELGSQADNLFDPFVRPTLYSAAPDLRRGIRVCCTFNDTIYLFTIPPDILHNIPLQTPTAPPIVNTDWPANPGSDAAHQAVAIAGVKIGTVNNLIDIAISTNGQPGNDGALYIYGFSSDGKVYTFAHTQAVCVETKIGRDHASCVLTITDTPHETHITSQQLPDLRLLAKGSYATESTPSPDNQTSKKNSKPSFSSARQSTSKESPYQIPPSSLRSGSSDIKTQMDGGGDFSPEVPPPDGGIASISVSLGIFSLGDRQLGEVPDDYYSRSYPILDVQSEMIENYEDITITNHSSEFF